LRSGFPYWRSVGEPERLFLSSVQVELKVNIPQDGLDVEAAFDDCRLYPMPERAPIRILVYKFPQPKFSFPGVTVTLLHQEKSLGSCVTGADGICTIPLSSSLY
jgi:hypothetical protein